MEPIGESKASPTENPPLVGDAIRHPGWLWLTHVIPAVLLFVSFFHAYYLISGETNTEQRWVAGALAVGLAVLTAAVGALAIRLQVRRQMIGNWLAVGLSLSHA